MDEFETKDKINLAERAACSRWCKTPITEEEIRLALEKMLAKDEEQKHIEEEVAAHHKQVMDAKTRGEWALAKARLDWWREQLADYDEKNILLREEFKEQYGIE